MANCFRHGYNLGPWINNTFHLLPVVDDHHNWPQSMQLLGNIEGDGSFSWSQTINVSLINIRNSTRGFFLRWSFIWYLLYKSVSGYHLVKDSLQCDSLVESLRNFWGYGEELLWWQSDEWCLHWLVVDVNDGARVLNRGYIVICWLLVFKLVWWGQRQSCTCGVVDRMSPWCWWKGEVVAEL
jgi:hypothetical protein